jgi:hypothetical protein
VWWYTSIIPVFWRRNLKASLSYIVRPVSIKKKKKKVCIHTSEVPELEVPELYHLRHLYNGEMLPEAALAGLTEASESWHTVSTTEISRHFVECITSRWGMEADFQIVKHSGPQT